MQRRRIGSRSRAAGAIDSRPAASRSIDVDIVRIGEQGDGIAETPDGRLFVPLTVGGDRVRVQPGRRRGEGIAAELLAVLTPGPERVEPPCPHFAVCGGCALQHLADNAYAAWKLGRLTTALARVGLADSPIASLVRTPPGSRRRATFAAMRPGREAGVLLGFQVRGSHAVVDLAVCPVLEPAIVALLPPLRVVLADILAPGGLGRVAVSRLDSGLDVLLESPAVPGAALRERLAGFADANDLARLSWRAAAGALAEPLALRRPVRAVFGG
ncbi:MAG TPA: class I SAM-dependent RNA methyltransferase, partial [Rhodospirillales bacterium]|nr:class I SAM-dependent RNA methyltransferase [Rhodospirillales bacterium]